MITRASRERQSAIKDDVLRRKTSYRRASTSPGGSRPVVQAGQCATVAAENLPPGLPRRDVVPLCVAQGWHTEARGRERYRAPERASATRPTGCAPGRERVGQAPHLQCIGTKLV